MSSNNFLIRKAKEKDLKNIMEIVKSCIQNLILKNIFQWNDNYPSLNNFKEDITKDNLYLLIIQDKIVIGCFSINYKMDNFYKNINWISPNEKNLYVHRLAIEPSFQNKGYGQLIMAFIEEKAISENCDSIRLDTFSLNKINNLFYEKIGFYKIGTIYFPDQSEFPFNCYEKPLKKLKLNHKLLT
tara:strand:+ start:366 stop:920 length:555 start_codon:yes stop_codon:yes gene_type:complete